MIYKMCVYLKGIVYDMEGAGDVDVVQGVRQITATQEYADVQHELGDKGIF